MKKLQSVLLIAIAAFLLAVPFAGATASDAVVQDAKDGRIDGTYTKSQLQDALASPLLRTYGGNGGVEAVKSAIGSQTEKSSQGNLPFTGAEMVSFVLIGGGLVITGFVLRRSGRRDGSA